MHVFRHFIAQRRLAVLICGAALLLKLLVPTGFMIGSDHGRMVIELCSGTGPRSSAMAMPGMHGTVPDHGRSGDHGKAEMPCAFSSLAFATMAVIDPVLLVALIAFVMRMGLAGSTQPSPCRRCRLRPPLRGPPAYP